MINGHSTLREFGKCRLDVEKKLLWADGEPVQLPLKAVELLCVLVENRGAVVTKDEIWQRVWSDAFVEETNLTHNIYILRKAFRDLDVEQPIRTIPRRGYRFTAEVREIPTGEIVLERHALTKTTIEFQDRSDVNTETARAAIAGSVHWRRLAFVAATVLFITGIGIWRYNITAATSRAPIRTLAVIPFRTIDAAPNDAHLGLVIADTLITRLSNIRSLTIRPTSSIVRFVDSDADSLKIGQQLQVDAVMEGTILRSSGKLRATIRLLRVADGQTIWTGDFEDLSGDDLVFGRSISSKAADALSIDVTATERAAVEGLSTTDEDAYRLYLKGRYEWNKRSWEGMAQAEKDFRSAIEKQPDFALAYVGLADRLAMTIDPTEADSLIQHALELEPDLAEAHATAGFLNTFHYWRWTDAENEFRKSIELKPNYGTAHQWYGNLLEIEGRYDEAISEHQRAVDIDPTSANFLADLGQAYYFLHDYDNAARYCAKAVEIDPDLKFAHDYLFSVALVDHDLTSAVSEWKTTTIADLKFANGSEQQLQEKIARLGPVEAAYRKGTAPEFIRGLIVRDRRNPQTGYHNARLYALLGDTESAIQELERGVETRSFGVVFVKADPVFDSIRSDPRYEAILKKMDL